MLKGSAFPLESGKNKITTGTFSNIRGIRCYEGGILDIKWQNDSVTSEEFVAGEDMEIKNCKSLTIVSGKFSLYSSTIA